MGTESGLRRRVQGLSEAEFRQRFGTEAACRAALFQLRPWPLRGAQGPRRLPVQRFRCVGWLQASSGPLPSDQTARPNTWWTRARCAGMSLAGTARACPLASIAIASAPASVRRVVQKL